MKLRQTAAKIRAPAAVSPSPHDAGQQHGQLDLVRRAGRGEDHLELL
jgi:hypothetical protein